MSVCVHVSDGVRLTFQFDSVQAPMQIALATAARLVRTSFVLEAWIPQPSPPRPWCPWQDG
eukprot:6190692-Pleurochrysis_carterae.AAC.1